MSRPGDLWRLGPHRVLCAAATRTDSYAILMEGEEARAVLTDIPFNVPMQGHVSSGGHREFVMAAGEMSIEAFRGFMDRWFLAASEVVEGGVLGSFIDWRSISPLIAAGEIAGLTLLNLAVWSKINAGMGSLWRSVQVPVRGGAGVSLAQIAGDRRSELDRPAADCLIAHLHTAAAMSSSTSRRLRLKRK